MLSSWDLSGPALDYRVLSWTRTQGACPEELPCYQLLHLEEATETVWVQVTGEGAQNGKQKPEARVRIQSLVTYNLDCSDPR